MSATRVYYQRHSGRGTAGAGWGDGALVWFVERQR